MDENGCYETPNLAPSYCRVILSSEHDNQIESQIPSTYKLEEEDYKGCADQTVSDGGFRDPLSKRE